MTLDRVYREIYSKLNLDGTDHKIYPKDIINAINDSIRLLRAEYTRLGLGSNFAITEMIFPFQDFEYEYLNSAELDKKIIDEVPLEMAVLTSLVYLYDQEIPNEIASFPKGTLATKGNFVYKAIDDIDNLNTFDATFELKEVRDFSEDNKLKYHEDDIVFSEEENNYLLVFGDRLYWKKVGRAFIPAFHYPFKSLVNIGLHRNHQDYSAINIKSNLIYTLSDVKKVVLSYIPRWEDVIDLEDELDIPEYIVPNVIAESINRLKAKMLGTFERRGDLEDTEEQEDE